jgi:hypothetical protein
VWLGAPVGDSASVRPREEGADGADEERADGALQALERTETMFTREAGLEPTTFGSGGRRSIQLSYSRRR